LRITFQNTPEAVEIRLEGRVAGPWASELDRVWVETAPQLNSRKLTIDLNNVTYADAAGKQVLRAIYDQTHANLIATSPWTQFLAEEVTASKSVMVEEGE
jgi:anti-anti-sigma regulatory factor